MIIVMNQNYTEDDVLKIKGKIEKLGLEAHISKGKDSCIIGMIGDTSMIDAEKFEAEACVDKVVRVTSPYKKASRMFHPDDTKINVSGKIIGGKNITVMAGPCAVENEKQLLTIAKSVKESGASFLRGGAYKPRTSPYSFQGLKEEGLKLLKEARDITGLPVVTEVISPDLVDKVQQYADILQVGARNMQNFELLKEVGRTDKPVLLKRGMSATIEELLMAAEYIMSEGNEKVILCERGIRTFETYTRNTLDLSAVVAIKKLSHLPVIVDPSHASGRWWMIEPLSKAAIAVGADGIEVEVHNDPENAMSDGKQSITCERFKDMMSSLKAVAESQGKSI